MNCGSGRGRRDGLAKAQGDYEEFASLSLDFASDAAANIALLMNLTGMNETEISTFKRRYGKKNVRDV